ncbi:hypothetical protein DFH09DRAFT_1174947 [Mycena vulgaris]|nr:hypothetical protein DFH09DRAFT_1174947 [Mycena vulgaris]
MQHSLVTIDLDEQPAHRVVSIHDRNTASAYPFPSLVCSSLLYSTAMGSFFGTLGGVVYAADASVKAPPELRLQVARNLMRVGARNTGAVNAITWGLIPLGTFIAEHHGLDPYSSDGIPITMGPSAIGLMWANSRWSPKAHLRAYGLTIICSGVAAIAVIMWDKRKVIRRQDAARNHAG